MDLQEASRSIHIRRLFGEDWLWIHLVHSVTTCNSSFGSYAIKGSPNQKLLLEDIYYAIESRVCAFYMLHFALR